MNNEMKKERTDKILIVDDTPANLQFLMNLLKEQGYSVFPASDGELALEFVRSTPPDLILLDIRMPGMDGYEVCRRLKADGKTRSIPIIFISVLEDERDKMQAFQAGGVDYITKPIRPEEALARIQTHLSLRKLTEHLEQAVAERSAELAEVNQELLKEITERRQAEEALFESEQRVRRKLDAILSPDTDINELELSDIIDCEKIQRLMDEFYRLTHVGIGIIDLKGNVLVGTGCPDICTKFHRANPDSCKLCIESDLELSDNVPPGTFKKYRCKNNMWDIATPIMLGDRHIGNIFLGQFLFDDETSDYETFRQQARQYGFNEKEYLAALDRVPRWSHEKVDAAMSFYAAFAEMIGHLSFGNIKLANALEERKRAERQLILLNFAMNNVQEAAFLIDADAHFHYVNDDACRVLGYTRDELLKMSVPDIDLDFPTERWSSHWHDLEKQHIILFEGRHRAKDGHIFPVEISANYFEYEDCGYNLALVRDITERKHSAAINAARLHLIQFSLSHSLDELLEETLNETELLTGSLIGFYHFVADDQKNLTLQNWSTRTKSEFCIAEGKGLHYSVDQAGVWVDCIYQRRPVIHNDYISLPHRKGMPDGHAQVIRELVVPVFRGEKISAILGVGNKSTDYTEKDVETVSLMASLAWEIAERKRAEEALHRLNRELRAISSCNQILMRAEDEQTLLNDICRIVCDEAGYRLAWVGYAENDNEKTVRPVAWSGFDDGYVANAKLSWSDDAERAQGPGGVAIRSGKTVYVEDFATDPRMAPWRESALQRGYRSTIALPLKDENAKVFGVLLIYSMESNSFTPYEIRILEELASDLAFGIDFLRTRAERKRVEEELRIYHEHLEDLVKERTIKLEEANKELEAFTYSVSHDLRAPLRHIDGFMELLQQRISASLDEKSLHYMTTILDEAKRMGLLIDDLLSFSRMGRQGLSMSQVDLNKLVQEIVIELESETKGRSINWHITGLPVVSADRTLIRAVLVNVISNAIKFTRPRAVGEIEIGSQGRQTESIIYVRDNGVGFDMQYIGKLFGVFQRLHSQEEFEGTGIGLATVHRIITRHGGRVWAEGEVGHGATFYFSLPQCIKEG